MTRLSIGLLGGFRAQLDSGQPLEIPRKKAQALLAYLAIAPGRACSREALASLLWSTNSDDQARHNLRQTLFALRQALGAHRSPLVVDGETVTLDTALVHVDVAAFERAVTSSAVEGLEEAAGLYRGDLLDGFTVREAPFDDWIAGERARLRELALEGLRKLLARQTQTGATERSVQLCLRLLALDPLLEDVHRTLMGLYARQGRRAAALKQYQTCADVLQRELRIGPEEATNQLYRELSQHRTSQAVRNPVKAVPTSTASRRRAPARPDRSDDLTPFAGRSAELARLKKALGDAWTGRGTTAVVSGEAGIGKSRLTEELAAEALKGGGTVLVGRAYETEQILAFGVWVSALRGGSVAERVETVNALGPARRQELARLLPEFADGHGDRAGAGNDYLRLFEAIVQLVTLLAHDEPLLVVIEDLHWADEMSLRLFSFLSRRIQDARILVVGTMREEELPDAPFLRRCLEDLDREPRLIRLALSPLSRSDTLSLVETVYAGRLSETWLTWLGEQAWSRSDGNPFIALETAQALGNTVRILLFFGLGPNNAPRNLPLPRSIRELVQSRLERLSDASQLVVATAAVIGREFEFALLQRAAELGDDDVADAAEELVKRRILRGVGDRFDFVHDRIREAAYHQLLAPRRRILHGRVARALEQLYAGKLEQHYTAVAVHHREAEVWDKALTYFRESGRQALARSAHREAVACFEQALSAIAHLPESRDTAALAIDLRFDLRNALHPLGEMRPILEHLCEAERLATALGDQRRLGRVHGYIANYLWWTGDPEGAVRSAQLALDVAEPVDDFALPTFARFRVGLAFHSLGEHRRAIEFLEKNIETLTGGRVGERFGLSGFPAVLSRCFLAWSLAELGQIEQALVRGREAVEIAEAVDHPFSLILGYFGLGMVSLRSGDLERAIPLLERSAVLCRAREVPLFSGWVTSALGFSYALSGRLAEALPLLEQGVAQAEGMNLMVYHPLRVAQLAEGRLLAGQTSEAQALAERALALATEHKEAGHRAWALRLLGEIASRRAPPDVETAVARYQDALGLAETLGMRPLLGHCRLGLGRLYARAANTAAAREHLGVAEAIFGEMGVAVPSGGDRA